MQGRRTSLLAAAINGLRGVNQEGTIEYRWSTHCVYLQVVLCPRDVCSKNSKGFRFIAHEITVKAIGDVQNRLPRGRGRKAYEALASHLAAPSIHDYEAAPSTAAILVEVLDEVKRPILYHTELVTPSRMPSIRAPQSQQWHSDVRDALNDDQSLGTLVFSSLYSSLL